MLPRDFSGPTRVATYVSLGVSGAMLATSRAEAEIVVIDLTSVGPNSVDISQWNPVYPGGRLDVDDWLGAGSGTLRLFMDHAVSSSSMLVVSYVGLTGGLGSGSSQLQFACSNYIADPVKFAPGSTIAAASAQNWSSSGAFSVFESYSLIYYNYQTAYIRSVSETFATDEFMGFRFGSAGNWRYGYLEVLWSWSIKGGQYSRDGFQIVSGAYETSANTAIAAGAIPAPGALPLLALMALGGGAFRRGRQRAS